MPRLRTTTGLSLLALLVGVLGTVWLSVRSDQWEGPRHPVVRVHTAPPLQARRSRAPAWHPPPRVVGAATPMAASAEPVVAAAPALVPVSMPALKSRYDAVRGHLNGSLVLAVTVSADGDVVALGIRRSSGDAVLDDYARQLVSRWRFAVRPGAPAGFSGELPMHFGSTPE